VGVDEVSRGTFVKCGVPAEQLVNFETSVINRAVRKFMTPSVPITVRRVFDEDKTFVFMEVPFIEDEIVLVAKMNANAGVYPGRIYIRTTACESSELQDATELKQLLDRIIRHRINALLSR